MLIFGPDVSRVEDLALIEGGLPAFHIPTVPLTLERFGIILPYAVILAAIWPIESLLTLNPAGEMTNRRGGASQECTAQGVANTVTGFFGGMGGCAMIGPSIINVKSRGRTRIAGICAAALQAIEVVAGKYPAAGKRLQLRHLTRGCHRMLNKAGHLMVDSDDDPDYGLAVDDDVKTGVLGGGH